MEVSKIIPIIVVLFFLIIIFEAGLYEGIKDRTKDIKVEAYYQRYSSVDAFRVLFIDGMIGAYYIPHWMDNPVVFVPSGSIRGEYSKMAMKTYDEKKELFERDLKKYIKESEDVEWASLYLFSLANFKFREIDLGRNVVKVDILPPQPYKFFLDHPIFSSFLVFVIFLTLYSFSLLDVFKSARVLAILAVLAVLTFLIPYHLVDLSPPVDFETLKNFDGAVVTEDEYFVRNVTCEEAYNIIMKHYPIKIPSKCTKCFIAIEEEYVAKSLNVSQDIRRELLKIAKEDRKEYCRENATMLGVPLKGDK
ncbi:hypothetical protein DRN82_05925 [Thermococci archaeon]|nr:MAG: hypothetical protein DRN82_05925 [Thermococci archaeon]